MDTFRPAQGGKLLLEHGQPNINELNRTADNKLLGLGLGCGYYD